MILPLHHCSAIGCMELTDPGTFMCRKHEAMISDETAKRIVTSKSPHYLRRAQDIAIREVAAREGRL